MMKINQNIILKALVFLLCLNLAIMPIFQYKTVKASTFDKVKAFTYATVEILMGLQAVGFISDTTLTPENLTNIYNKADEYLHENFGTELEYAEALRQVDQLGLDIASGQIFVPGNYSGKLWYSFLNAVKDVVWPYKGSSEYDGQYYLGTAFGFDVFSTSENTPSDFYPYSYSSYAVYIKSEYSGNENITISAVPCDRSYGGRGMILSVGSAGSSADVPIYNYTKVGEDRKNWIYYGQPSMSEYAAMLSFIGPSINFFIKDSTLTKGAMKVPNMTAKTANKVKLPTRLPQTVINNINNYIDNSTENLIIAPTADELPTLPENYNPVTDDPPDLPGYEDVTPDQEPTPTPTPEPTPEPTPTPTAPEYDGSHWVNPIGEFIAGLLEFLKSAFIPTMSIDTSPLTDANFDMANKFPFSLPNTFKTLLMTVNAPGKTPVFDMTFDMTKLGFEAPIVWHIDLHEWDTGAEIAKTSLYIIFLLGLILMTKKLFVK
ncbi:hypothetical protein [Eubacterium sp. 1001713B170207_170306_E7]|uniref:hypothetical protein n=1 Tax=Eubacterium sp. 1001713B170207_170306_E7 TaxID=2787097 RepID=UPI001899930B|nr:hypothetical protein [Eubacterium sp. 1001713B170207_170306_E7]